MNEERIFLTDYIEKMRTAYHQARAAFEIYSNALEKEKANWEKEQRRGWNDPKDRQEATTKYQQTRTDLKNRLEAVVREAKAEFAEIQTEAAEVFGRHYRATPEQIDEKAMLLINSGAMSDSDLMALADEYPENYTMRKLLGAKLVERGEKRGYREMADKGRLMQLIPNTHNEALEAVTMWAEYGLKPFDNGVSAAFDRQFDQRIDDIAAKVQGYSIPKYTAAQNTGTAAGAADE